MTDLPTSNEPTLKFVDSALVTLRPGETFKIDLRFPEVLVQDVKLTTIRFKKPEGMEPEDFLAILRESGFDVTGIVVKSEEPEHD